MKNPDTWIGDYWQQHSATDQSTFYPAIELKEKLADYGPTQVTGATKIPFDFEKTTIKLIVSNFYSPEELEAYDIYDPLLLQTLSQFWQSTDIQDKIHYAEGLLFQLDKKFLKEVKNKDHILSVLNSQLLYFIAQYKSDQQKGRVF